MDILWNYLTCIDKKNDYPQSVLNNPDYAPHSAALHTGLFTLNAFGVLLLGQVADNHIKKYDYPDLTQFFFSMPPKPPRGTCGAYA